jgi:hypothetical protein
MPPLFPQAHTCAHTHTHTNTHKSTLARTGEAVPLSFVGAGEVRPS